jgi:aerobic carbon-monoxide dehydrogenase medium subunit
MTPFELVEPAKLKEAVALLDPDDPTIRPIAGGTALMLMMKSGVFRPTKLVSLARIKDLTSIAAAPDGELTIGAMTPLGVIERAVRVARSAPVVTQTMLTLSNVRVRNVATIGGALAHGDPHMDLPPVLMALGAVARVLGPDGERSLPVEEMFAGYFETNLAKNELIADVRIPAQGKKRAAYLKVTTGSADDWPALGVAAVIGLEDGVVTSARIVVSAATDKVTRLKETGKVLKGAKIDKKLDARLVARLGDAAVAEAQIVSDGRGSAAYKRELLRVYVGRAVRAAMMENGATH